MSHLHVIVPILQHIVNPCLTTGDFPFSCKSSIVIPLIKKPSANGYILLVVGVPQSGGLSGGTLCKLYPLILFMLQQFVVI